MKTYTLLVCLACTFFIIASNHTKEESTLSPLIISTLNDEPILPESPFDYNISLPEHLLELTPRTGGYGSGHIDTTVLPLIDPNIATLGRVLFYDKVLSANEDISCGSCHIQSKSFADNHPLSTGVSQPTKRNSMHLNDLAWSNQNTFFWDMRHNNLQGAIGLPLRDENEIGATMADIEYKMSNSAYYPALFEKAYGDTYVSEDRITQALQEFILSINSTNSRFDQIMASPNMVFSPSEANGMEIFSKDCSSCHVQGLHPFFSQLGVKDQANMTFNGYLDDDGDKGVTQNVVNLPPLFKMPTIRNIAVTGPYMHDGDIPDLDSLINFYSHGIVNPTSPYMQNVGDGFNYSDQEKANLKAFLMTLTDESMLTDVKWSDPFSLTRTSEKLDADVVISPNPSYDIARIKVDGKAGKRKDIMLTDIQGRIVMQDYFMDDEYQVNVQDLSSGMYLLRLSVGNEMGSYKIVIN